MENNNTQIPAGYKMTSLGVIPQEWEVKRLGEIVKIASGESPILFHLTSSGKYPYVKVEDMNNCEKYQINSREYSNDEKSVVIEGSIIFPKRGAAILNNKVRIASTDIQMDSNMMAITPDDKTINVEYLYYRIVCEQLFKIADTSTIPQINNKHIMPYKLAIPPLPEQQKIAEILGVWDRGIELQGRAVERLELRKRALMQRLLTARTRLKGFSGEWNETHIKDFSKEVSIRNKSNKDIIVLSCTKYDGLVPSLEYFGRKIFADDTSGYKVVHKNHFAYATNHIEEGSIGYQKNYDEALVSPMYTVFKTNASVNDGFLYTLFKSHRLIYQYNARMEGSIDRRGGLRWDSFSTIKIKLPAIAEQTAIAEILTDADREIALARAKLTTLRQQKKALMQQLLTGKIRVKI